MAGTMSEKELKINCGSKVNANVPDEKGATGYNNAAAMTIVNDTMYWVKAHKRVNSQNVYKSTLYKATGFETAGDSIDIEKSKVAVIDYFVYGMTVKEKVLYLTCKKSASDAGILAVNLSGKILSYTPLSKTYVGIASYTGKEFLLMEYLDAKNSDTLKFARGSLNDFSQHTQKEFTVVANDAAEYVKANGIYFDINYGLFILTNHYITDYSQCKNRILLVRAADYKKEREYYPYAVFQADFDSGKYKQFNFEGIVLYKDNMWELSNVIGSSSNSKAVDCVTHQAGVTFTRLDTTKNEFENGYFSFKGSTTTGAALPTEKVKTVECANVQSMATDGKGKFYCLKVDKTNMYAKLFQTATPESGTAKSIAVLGEDESTRVYHSNGMTYNPDDDNLYVVGYGLGASEASYIITLSKQGESKDRFKLENKQYGIAYYGKEDGKSSFILMNRMGTYNPIVFDKAVLNGKDMEITTKQFCVDIARKSELQNDADTLQDIYYHKSYGLFIPVSVSGGSKLKDTIYHISKESVEDAMAVGGGILKPDFAVVLEKNGQDFYSYEVESMDINNQTKKMVICGNFRDPKKVENDSFDILTTLTFN